MDGLVLAVFATVYLGMLLGRLPGLAIDRTGVALLGAIVLIAGRRLSAEAAWAAIDVPTIALLLGLMVVSAQLRLGGLYSELTRRIASARLQPATLLLLVCLVAAGLSAVVANDVVCLAMTPLLAAGCLRRGLDPLPFLLALACASNVGSAATLIGNPQNMLIGQRLSLGFAAYLADGVPVAVLGTVATWAIIAALQRRRWWVAAAELEVDAPALDRWQSAKGVATVAAVVLIFLLSPWPREVVALTAAGVLLLSRSLHTRHMLGLVDWQLLVLFCGLFVVNHALAASGMVDAALAALSGSGVDVTAPAWLFPVTVLLSNIVSNVPAVMLLLPAATHPHGGAVLALASTLAGNLLLVGSIANLIVAYHARSFDIRIGWRDHARVGVPVTAATLAIAAAWLAL